MLRAFACQYKDGLVGSLQGFLVLHKLDRPESRGGSVQGSSSYEGGGGKGDSSSSSSAAAKHSSLKSQSQTVLGNRRRKTWEQAHMGQKSADEKELGRKVSTLQRVLRCALANIASVLMVLLLTYLVELLKFSLLSTFIKYLGSLLLMPIFLTVRLLSILWFADVAGAAYKYRGLSGSRIPDFSRAASDFLHAIFVELVFFVQALIIQTLEIPILSPVFGFIYMCLLHSLYSFDYIWMSSGVSMHSRLAMVERHWPFHLGFGTLLTLASSISPNFLINGCVFGALFPFFIVSSFLVDHPPEKRDGESGVPAIHFYSIAQTLTNQLSVALFGKICC